MSEDAKVTQEKAPSYDVFLTWRHYGTDAKVARLVAKKIHDFHIPVEYRADYGDSRFRNIYKDSSHHSNIGGLSDAVKKALDASRFLMVICTPATKDSTRINREIEYFLEHHERERLLTILAKGTTAQSFPQLLTKEYEKNGITFMREEESVDADFTGGGEQFQKKRVGREMTKLFAQMLSCPYETLWHHDRRFRLRRIISILAAGVLALAVTGGILIYRNRLLHDSETLTSTAYEETRSLAASTMVDKGEFLLRDGDWKGAVSASLEALPLAAEGSKEHARAQALLTSALGAYKTRGMLRESYELTVRGGLDHCIFSTDGTRIYTVDAQYDVRCFDVEEGKQLFVSTHRTPIREEGQGEIAPEKRLVLLEEFNLLLCNSPGSIRAISLDSGDVLWEYYLQWENDFRILNNARDAMAILDREETEESTADEVQYEVKIKLLDLHNGIITRECAFRIPSSFLFDYVKEYGGNNGIFTREDDRFLGAIYVDEKRQHDENNRAAGLLYFSWNYSDENAREEISYFHAEGVWEDFTNPIFGMYLDESGNSVMVTRYDTSSESVRMQQVRLDGLRRDPYLVPQRLRGTAPEEESAYLSGAQMIVVSVNDTLHLFRTANSAYCMSKREEADILNLSWLNEEETVLTAMLDDGTIVIYDLDALSEDGNFIASRTVIPVIEEAHVERTYASRLPVRQTSDGYELDTGITMVVLLKDTETGAAVYKPFTDAHAADLTPSLPSAERVRLSAVPGEEDMICFVRTASQTGASIYKIDTVTLAVTETGHTIHYPAEEEELVFTQDVRHFKCAETLYDFADGSVPWDGHEETLLTEDTTAHYAASMTESGTLYLYNADNERMIFRGENDVLHASDALLVHADEANGRIFIGDGTATTCLDLRTFEQIFTVEGTVYYAPVGNKLFVNLTNDDGEGVKLVAFPAYTLDELVAWGEEVLEE